MTDHPRYTDADVGLAVRVIGTMTAGRIVAVNGRQVTILIYAGHEFGGAGKVGTYHESKLENKS